MRILALQLVRFGSSPYRLTVGVLPLVTAAGHRRIGRLMQSQTSGLPEIRIPCEAEASIETKAGIVVALWAVARIQSQGGPLLPPLRAPPVLFPSSWPVLETTAAV